MTGKCNKHIFDTIDELSDFSAQLLLDNADKAISDHGKFTLGVSGGSIINLLAAQLVENSSVQWNKWKIFFCDERLTPFDNTDSTYGQFKTKLIDKVGHDDSWVSINPNLPVEECAADYEKKIRNVFSGCAWPEFDLLLLGMGPDGHTCSLFPGHKLLQEDKLWIAPISDSPKPPPCRVTMTLPVLNHARNVAFISAGSGKADTIKAVFAPVKESERLPAARVRPLVGSLHWIMDSGAASKL